MAYEKRPNSGTLFANKSKQKETSPDYSGEVIIDVRTLKAENGLATLRLAGWKKTGKSGASFLSLALSEPMQQQQQAAPAASLADMEDDVPF